MQKDNLENTKPPTCQKIRLNANNAQLTLFSMNVHFILACFGENATSGGGWPLFAGVRAARAGTVRIGVTRDEAADRD